MERENDSEYMGKRVEESSCGAWKFWGKSWNTSTSSPGFRFRNRSPGILFTKQER